MTRFLLGDRNTAVELNKALNAIQQSVKMLCGKMKLPVDSIIPSEKATQYLLVPQVRGDKVGFLELAGYSMNHAARLLDDLRAQLAGEAVPTKSNQFGQYYEIRGRLTGPNGVTLAVRTIWMTEHLSGETRFVTLVPDKRRP